MFPFPCIRVGPASEANAGYAGECLALLPLAGVGRLPRRHPRWGDAPCPFAPIADRHLHSIFSGGTLTGDENVLFTAGRFCSAMMPMGRCRMRPPLKQLKIIVAKHPDGYVAYPLSLKGIVVGEGDTYEESLAYVRLAIRFHIETFGPAMVEGGLKAIRVGGKAESYEKS